jgi:hypothetical protein
MPPRHTLQLPYGSIFLRSSLVPTPITMVSWESKSYRGRHPLNRSRGQRSSHNAKPAPPKGKTPTKEAAPSPAPAPRDLPIARKMAKHALP